MLITVITNTALKNELLQQVNQALPNVQFVASVNDVQPPTNVVIDLLFTYSEAAVKALEVLQADMVVVHAPLETLQQLPANFVRVNAWPTFLQRNVVEASASMANRTLLQQVFAVFNKKLLFTPDVIGFISARVMATIINEAYLSLQEGLSTKDEIDTAMKMGTNYPYGPFEWASKIGVQQVATLLQLLSQQQQRYMVAPLLAQEINA